MPHPAGHPGAVDFDQAPFLVIWETTRSCGLSCRHCRADAILGRDPGELSTAEGIALMRDVASMGTPIFILSGGDPLNRPDLEELIRGGKAAGLRVGTIPAATENLTRERILALKEAGIDQLAFSLDGPNAALHDGFRRVPGSFERTLEGVSFVHEAGVPLQINTVLAAWNFRYLEDMVKLVTKLKAVFWEVFFLIPIGRGAELTSITPDQFEDAFERLHRLNAETDCVIKLTEAPHYRRFVVQKEAKGKDAAERIRHILARPRGVGGAMGLSPQAVNAGKGFAFVDHLGNVCPSGFLPEPAGNVRRTPLSKLYREAPIFVTLRNPAALTGKCGRCEFARMCSGSRARAWAVTGDMLASDPYCVYEPS
ncbi:MAG: TIGR04053 family radical SAM/SPASM domain-containing protein [Elusimicrobia bacterium]|nr:TIGR04053 family radical SAM/SPASM domain-containing protein [Elusimicrobiota bacterium]